MSKFIEFNDGEENFYLTEEEVVAGLKKAGVALDQAPDNTDLLVEARDMLRQMYRTWHSRGPHTTYDAPTIEKAILTLDAEIDRRGKK